MSCRLSYAVERFATRGEFRISRSSVSEVVVVTVTLSEDGHQGRGECRPYARYGESAETVVDQIRRHARDICAAPADTRLQACRAVPPGAAANALESAVVDLLCKRRGLRAWEVLGCPAPSPRTTAFTLSVASPEAMATAAREASRYPLLKIKIGAAFAAAQVEAVANARPDARLIVDANEALDGTGLSRLIAGLPERVALIEQPLPDGAHARLPEAARHGPAICADESLHTSDDLPRLREAGYRAVNVKLDKAGGPARALELIRSAKKDGFEVMAGCMVGSSLAMAPMIAIAAEADFLDLDGPLLLAEDRAVTVPYDGPIVGVPPAALWG